MCLLPFAKLLIFCMSMCACMTFMHKFRRNECCWMNQYWRNIFINHLSKLKRRVSCRWRHRDSAASVIATENLPHRYQGKQCHPIHHIWTPDTHSPCDKNLRTLAVLLGAESASCIRAKHPHLRNWRLCADFPKWETEFVRLIQRDPGSARASAMTTLDQKNDRGVIHHSSTPSDQTFHVEKEFRRDTSTSNIRRERQTKNHLAATFDVE